MLEIFTTINGTHFQCMACTSGQMNKRSKESHEKRAAHKENVKGFESLCAGTSGHSEPSRAILPEQDVEMNDSVDPSVRPNNFEIPQSPCLEETIAAIHNFDRGDDHNSDDEHGPHEEVNWDNWLAYEMDHAAEDISVDNADDEEDDDSDHQSIDEGEWFPFKSKLEFLGSVLVGYTRRILSRSAFDQIRAYLTIGSLKIPAWSTIRRAQKRIRNYLNVQINVANSVWGVPCAALSLKDILQKELSNPLVAPFLDFYPEDAKGLDVYKLSQSKKWLELLPRQFRTQMCTNNTKHFYVYEPLETYSKKIVIPIFIHQINSVTHAKCLVICRRPHTPLPRKLCIPEKIAFNDPNLELIAPVFVMSTVLFFLADSPMHAEITNTPCPSSALNPCRFCTLSAPKKIEKDTKIYIQKFLEVDSDGCTKHNPLRIWEETVTRTYDLYNLTNHSTMKEFNKMSIKWGIKDSMNRRFIESRKDKIVKKKTKELIEEDPLSNAIAHYPFHKKVACKHEDQAEPPTALKRWLNDREFVQILDLQLNKHEATENPETRIRYIGFVNSLWKVSSNYYVNVTKLSKSTIHPFYGMREFIKTSDSCSFDSKAILAILNFQHNCFDADCPIKNTKTTRVERQDTTIRTAEVCHTNKTNFILNSASFHAPDYHREMADLFVPTIQPSEMAQAIDEGYDKWMHPDEIITPNQESETTSSSDAEIDENLELEDTPSLESTSESSELLDM
ncbi:hypothetical protein MJO28_015200 [Puccinia striiformis f. sp. tritici]|uniref:Uncharacterized protein n=1 Tax=Puccinia striiformis f. sp. tritici TaxID=168172 RepID=A0ACC0DTW9_9BASI|nr:hypothetical protein MJO28_015200 [Puccinia striiformis f. sp. tritici]